MQAKKVVLVGNGYVMQMVKYYLSEITGVAVVEIQAGTNEEMALFVKQEQPDAIIIEQSPASQGFLEMLFMIARNTNIKLVEVNPHSNTIHVANWNQIRLERMQDFMAVL